MCQELDSGFCHNQINGNMRYRNKNWGGKMTILLFSCGWKVWVRLVNNSHSNFYFQEDYRLIINQMCSLLRKYPKASLPKKQVFILNSLLNLLICVFDTCWTFMKTRWGLLTQSSSGWCASAIGQLWRLTYIQWWQMAMCKMFWNNVSQRCMEVTMGVHHTAQCLRAMQLKGENKCALSILWK